MFAQGCPQCDYRYEREAGYFTGASWMIAYPVLALMGLSLSLLFKLVLFPKLPTLVILLLVSLLSLFIAVLLIPYCMSAWMCVDHFLHPLDQNDSYTQPPKH
ncbi:MAG: hypothetical protein OXT67_05660 [Zetaproteobacteria bacterium]|nr:hypothetical protein [Zetaproteobacteria bacterium]